MKTIAVHPHPFLQRLWSCVPWFPFGVALAGSTAVSFFPGGASILPMMISFLLVFALLVIQFFQIGAATWRRQWRLGAKRLMLLMIGIPLALIGAESGDYLHLAILYPSYRAEIAQASERPVKFPWGDQAAFVGDGLQFRTLVYDDTGNTARAAPRVEEGICVTDNRLIGNFFIELSTSIQVITRCGNS